ncbi:centromere protein T isoform X1 [Acanthochromis polyacanthus]|uniref:centromere protein T isoform X1 n=1 Tax=Acanthochromis polyacanthus TaxID=80966 RepID=UPI0022345681|nr:centromere protein T isoform X1 [Acanthochromis polyacanthus]
MLSCLLVYTCMEVGVVLSQDAIQIPIYSKQVQMSLCPLLSCLDSSVSRGASSSGTRQSARLRKKNAGPQTPQDILRRSLKHKIRESITRKSLPATRRRTASVALRKTNTPAPVLFDDADTPRHILMNILQTEPVHSPVVHEEGAFGEPAAPSDKSVVSRTHSSIELSGLDLPDITIGNIPSTAKGLSRKRPRRSLNVTAFEKRLKVSDDAEEVTEESIDNPSLLSLSSSSSLSLKTPFVGGQTEKRGLQRRVSNRRTITVEEFGAAVKKLQMGAMSRDAVVQRDLGETAFSEGFTLGLSKLSEPDITTDIVNCNTALYDQPDAITSNFSIVATQDKPTVMASQLQRQIEQEEQVEKEQSNLGNNIYVFPSEEEVGDEVEIDTCDSESPSQEDVEEAVQDPAVVLKPEEEDVAESQTSVTDDVAESEEEANRVETQTEEEGATDSRPEEDVEAGSNSEEAEVAPDLQTEEEEENAAEAQTEDESAVDSQPEEDVEAGSSQAGEDEAAPASQTEKEDEEEDGEAESQTEEGGALSQFEGDAEVESQSDREEGEAESQNNDDDNGKQKEEEQTSKQLKGALDHISQRAYRSEGALIVPVRKAGEDLANNTVAGWSDARYKADSALDLHSGLEMGSYEGSQPHAGEPDFTDSSPEGQTDNEPDANKENSFHPPEMAQDTEDSGHPRDASPEQPPAEEASEQEEDEYDDEEDEEFPCTTPAFVREKRNFLQPEPSTSPSVFKNIQASRTSEALASTKPKQVRQRKKGPAKKSAGLPKSYLMAVFRHFAKTKVSADVYPVLSETMDKFFDRLVEDLETYAAHAKRKTIEVEDCILLLKRQGYVNDKVPVEVLIEKYLSMQQRKLLIPIATSGNVVIPKMRR